MDFSIIIPVYKEQSIINKCLEHLASVFTATAYEIIVVDCEEGGATVKTIVDKDVRCLVSEIGRALQMNAGAVAATGKILLFIHCDTTLPDNAPVLIKERLNLKYKAGAFDICIDSQNRLLRLISITSSIRSRITGHPYGDQVHFFERDYFFSLGMYKEIPIMEDIEIMQRIKKKGDKIGIIKQPVKTSDRRWLKDGIVFVMLRNPVLTLLYYIGVPPQKLKSYY